jgi:uncharacterized protein (DUF433 family)
MSEVEKLPSEEWRAVPDFEDRYEVSNLGRVKSFARRRERILKATPCCGYLQVGLSEDGQVTYKKVHALVLTAFVGPCPEGMESRHLNGDRQDNRLINLCWGTKLENAADKHRHGTMARGDRSGPRLHPELLVRGDQHWTRQHPDRVLRGENNGSAKLTDDAVRDIVARWRAGETQIALAKEYGVTDVIVSAICRGETWKHLGLIDPSSVISGPLIGERNPFAKLTDAWVREILARLQAGESQTALAREFGVLQGTISKLYLGHTWKHITAIASPSIVPDELTLEKETAA